jgi:uncharacterized membrane protein YdjX (TVP38/TMEM64 family)
MKKAILVLVVVAAIASYFLFDLGQYLSLENFKARQAEIIAAKNASPVLYIAGFFLIYVAVTGLSIPGAAIMTLIWVQSKFGERLKAIDDGLAKDGAFYLFTLRLIPVFPFFVINLLMGLTRIKTGTYFWVSQLGMLAGTIVYVNAGTQISQIESTAGLLSPMLIGSFVALALFPWAAKGIIAYVNRRRG